MEAAAAAEEWAEGRSGLGILSIREADELAQAHWVEHTRAGQPRCTPADRALSRFRGFHRRIVMSDKQQTSQVPDNPGVRVPPPILLIVVVLVGYGLQQAWALELPNGSGWSVAARALIGVGVAILTVGWVQFYRAKTNIQPHKPASNLMQSGLYGFSRNPIYVSGLLLQLGIALLMNNLWIVLFVPVSKFVFDRYIIAREEAYLERAFGEVYVDYKRTVRRWL